MITSSDSRTSFKDFIYLPMKVKVKLSLCLMKHYTMNIYGGVEM